MPVKRLVADELQTANGEVCALGAVGAARGLNMSGLDPENHGALAKTFDIARQLACEIMFMNDEYGATPAARWKSMRNWVAKQIKGDPA